jgi:serine/threonine protein kinase/tetratricopeptide (TPR) repeat protein
VPEPGDLIGPFRLVSQLGRGAMGEVWRARDERLDRYVALKVLPADAAGDIERRARMLREARAAAAIRHANVVTLFDIVAHKGDDILVMELVEGRTLSEALRKDGRPTLEVALRWIEGVADALVAAHGRGILHRDIKAANIMVTPDGIKVLDFGLAKLRDSEPLPSTGARRVIPNAAIAHDATMASLPSIPAPLIDTRPSTPNALAVSQNRARACSAPPIVAAGSQTDEPATVSDSSLDETVKSQPNAVPAETAMDVNSYRTHAGQLLGTPLYMAPEQVDGGLPDERSEVFSVGVLAHEILAGKPPYTATSIDALFEQIVKNPPPPLPDDVPTPVEAIVTRALAKDPVERYPSMQGLRDAIAAERRRLFAPSARRWPLLVAVVLVLVGAAAAVWFWQANRSVPVALDAAPAPGDDYVRRALEEYDVFYNEKATSSLRAALSVAPAHPRALAYMMLFGGGGETDRTNALTAAQHALPGTAASTKDRALLEAAIALISRGPRTARDALASSGAASDRELAFWAAELDYRSGNYAAARDEYKALLAEPAHAFRGRIYDHYSSVLLYLDDPIEALRIGTLYRDAFPGEADAVGVYATTLGAAGQHDKAIAAAEEALRLSEGEDTLAGLAKVVAHSGNHSRARELYQRSLDRAGVNRRPIRRAALGLLQWIEGDLASAKATVSPCLAGGSDSTARERGACLFVAGIVDPERAEEIASQLDALADDATDARPAYGSPSSLAKLVRARATFFAGACVVDPARADIKPPHLGAPIAEAYTTPLDFFAAYHVPFFSTWALCERAAATGDRTKAREILEPAANRAPNRKWLLDTLKRY